MQTGSYTSIYSYFTYVLWLSLPLAILPSMGARQDLWLDFHNFLEGLCLLNRDLKGSKRGQSSSHVSNNTKRSTHTTTSCFFH